jgi:cytochrome c oxidase subunit 2
MRIRLIVEDEAAWQAWCKEQKPLLTTTPELASRIPSNLKAKAAKYLDGAAPSDNTTASAQQGGVNVATAATVR